MGRFCDRRPYDDPKSVPGFAILHISHLTLTT